MKKFLLYKTAALFMFLGLAAISHANILKVSAVTDGAPGCLRNQITAAAPGDTVLIDVSGTMIMFSNLTVNKTITIIGPTAKYFTIDANSYQLIFSSAAVTNINVEGIHFVNSPCPCGPFFKIDLSVVARITNCVFDNLNTGSAGGAINMLGSAQLNVYNCSFFNCIASGDGGAISVGGGNICSVNNSTFFNNSGANGGAIACSGGTVKLINNTFMNNTASGNGHAVFTASGATVVLQNNIFTDVSPPKCNSVCYSGGGPSWGSNGGNVLSAVTPFGFITFTAADIYNISFASMGLRPNAVIDGYGLKYYTLLSGSSAIDKGTTGALVTTEDTRRAPRIIYGATVLKPDAGACEFTPYTVTQLSGALSFSSKMAALNSSVDPGPLYMDFDIATPGTINLAAVVSIVHGGVFIDGYTQDGSKVYGPGATPLTVSPFLLPNDLSGPVGATNISISVPNVRIEGLRFKNSNAGITVTGGGNVEIYGNDFTSLVSAGISTNGFTGLKIGTGKYFNRNHFGNIGGDAMFISQTDGVTIQGNFIGVDVNGTTSDPNNRGIVFNIVNGGTVGGNHFRGQGNTIGGNNTNGIDFTDAENVAVTGNFIGLEYKGVSPIDNLVNGIYVTTSSATGPVNIGAVGIEYRNFICNSDPSMGTGGAGIKVENHNVGSVNIYNNSIGVNAVNAIAPNATGIAVLNALGVSAGDGSYGMKNIISGNNGIGIYIDGPSTTGNYFNKNYVGIKEGNTAAPNGGIGVHIVNGAASNTIINHVIANSGSGTMDGVSLNGAGNGNNINGNFIGTDSSGTTSMPNYNGISLMSTGAGTVLGINIIAGNSNHGIYFNGFTGNALVRLNKIGLSLLGTPLANMFGGVFIENSSNIHIGTTSLVDSNTIAYNGSYGVLADPNSSNIGILGNSIYQNGILGISLQSGTPLPNDANDADGPGSNGNLGQNYPDNVLASTTGSTTTVSGSMEVGAGPYNLIIQFFTIPIPMIDGSGHGEGRKFVGSTTISGTGPGPVAFAGNTTIPLPIGTVISTTATRDAGAGIYLTSEFSDTAGVRSGLSASIIDSADVTCNGAADGMAEVGVTSGIGPYTYAWYTTAYSFTGITTTIAGTLGPGSYVCIVTDGGCGCSDTSNAVTISQPPVLTFIPEIDTTICQGVPFTHPVTVVGGTGPFTFNWSPPANLVNPTVEDAVLTTTAINTPGSVTYTVQVIDSHGCTATDVVVVTVNAPPTVNAGSDFSACSGSSVTLIGSGSASTYTWDNGVIDGTAFIPTGTLTYTCTGYDAAGCTNTDAVTVTIDVPYTVNAGADLSVCNTSSALTLTGTSSSPGITWTTNGGGTFAPSATSFNPTYTLAGADSSLGSLYFILSTNPFLSCGPNDDTVFVTFVPGPDPTFSYSSSTFCSNDPASTPTASTPGGYYDVVGGLGVTMNTTTGQIYPSLSAPGVHYIYHEITSPCYAVDTVMILINAAPAVSITDHHIDCYGDTIQFLATPAGGTWSGITFGLSATTGQWINWLSGPGFQTVTYTYTDITTGCTAQDTNKIYIRPAPVVTITGVTSGPYCPSDGPFTVVGVPSGGIFLLNNVFAGISTFTYDPLLVQTDTISYIYQDPVTTCYGYAQVLPVVSAAPPTPILSATPPYEYCGTSPSTISVSNASSTVSWFSDPGLTNLITTGVSISTSSLPGGTNTVYVVNNVGATCMSSPFAFTYTNYDNSLINFGGPYSTCPNTPVTLNVSFTGSGMTFQWAPDSSLSGNFSPNPIVTPSQTSTYYVLAVPSTLPACIIIDSVTVTVQPCSLDDVTNAFTPDGDGVNDTWIINGIQLHPQNNVVIFNRWGNKMIEINNYDNVTHVWDGKYNGSLVAAGTYYFMIQYFDDGEQKAGWIQINY